LIGPEPFSEEERQGMPSTLVNLGSDKVREPDPECRKMLVEILAMLTRSRPCREIMRAKKVYPIVRNVDTSETNEAIKDVVYTIVSALLPDEVDDTPKIQVIEEKPAEKEKGTD